MTTYDDFRETKAGRVRYVAFLCLVAVNTLWERLPRRVREREVNDPRYCVVVCRQTKALRAYITFFLPALRWAAPHLFGTSGETA